MPSTGALAADKNKDIERAEQATQKTQDGGPFTSGTGFQFRPYIEAEGGYDSNPDNLFNQDESSFLKVEGGFKAIYETSREYYRLDVKGRYIRFEDLDEDIRDRNDFKAALETSYILSSTETLSTGSYFLRDFISLARADIYHSYAEYALRQDNWRINLQGKTHVESNDDDAGAGDGTDDFNVSRGKAFDFARTDGQVNVLTFTQQWLQPFAILDYANIDYYNQISGASIDRSATEFYGIAGVRIQTAKNFRIDVGYRYNNRDIEDQIFGREVNGYFDINAFWKPIDTLRFTGIIERHFDEPGSSFGIVEDVKTYGVTFDWDLAEKWRLTGTGYYDREDVVGEDRLDKKFTSTLALSYYPNDNTELFLSGLAKWVEEEFSGDSYDRYKIGAGARLKF